MKQIIRVFILVFPAIVEAQSEGKGIHFVNDSSWEQVREKAKVDHKFIFLDCFTTWCGPCREMEAYIYPLEQVGDFFNDHFISVKVQIDTTGNDSENVKEWYSDARKIARDYDVQAYPTFLFFSTEGKIIHRATGGYPAKQFIALARNAMDSAKQYYTLLANYHPEHMSLFELRRMADSLRYNGPELAQKVVVDYLNRLTDKEIYSNDNLSLLREFKHIPRVRELAEQYVNRLNVDDLKNRLNRLFVTDFRQLSRAKQLADEYISGLTESDLRDRSNCLFVIPFLQNSKDIGFAVYYANSQIIDSMVGVGYAEGQIASVIAKEEIDPVLTPAIQFNRAAPEWKKVFRMIKQKYSVQYAGYCTSLEKCKWYAFKNDHVELFKSQVLLYDKYGASSGSFNLNNAAWSIFLNSDDTNELKKALSWSERAVMMDPDANWMDTYANILYKLGRIKEATEWEAVASRLDLTNKAFGSNLVKMKKGDPTWPVLEKR